MEIRFQIAKDNGGVAVIYNGGRVGFISDWYTSDAKIAMYKPLGVNVISRIMREFDVWVKQQAVEHHTFTVTVAVRKNTFDNSDVTLDEWLAGLISKDQHVCGVHTQKEVL